MSYQSFEICRNSNKNLVPVAARSAQCLRVPHWSSSYPRKFHAAYRCSKFELESRLHRGDPYP